MTTFTYLLAQYTNQSLVPSTALVDHLFDIDIETFSSDVLETMSTAFRKRFCYGLTKIWLTFPNNNFSISDSVLSSFPRGHYHPRWREVYGRTRKSLLFLFWSLTQFVDSTIHQNKHILLQTAEILIMLNDSLPSFDSVVSVQV